MYVYICTYMYIYGPASMPMATKPATSDLGGKVGQPEVYVWICLICIYRYLHIDIYNTHMNVYIYGPASMSIATRRRPET